MYTNVWINKLIDTPISKAGADERKWNQDGKLKGTIQDPPRVWKKDNFIVFYLFVLHFITCLKTCYFTTYFTSLRISVSISIIILHVKLSRCCWYLLIFNNLITHFHTRIYRHIHSTEYIYIDLERKVGFAFIIVWPCKNGLQRLWAGLHPRAIQSQPARVPNFLPTYLLVSFLSWVVEPQLNHWTKRVVTRSTQWIN